MEKEKGMETQQIIALVIFLVAIVAIMTEKVHRAVAAVAGAVLMLFVNIMNVEEAISYIDFNTIGVLVGMMLFVAVVRNSGLFEYLAIKGAKIAKGDPWRIMVLFVVITAVCSAFLDNVTTVLLVGPMTIAIAEKMKLNPVPILMAQIMASNIGGTATLIGDPPNIMIGSSAHLSFMDFVVNVGPAAVVVLIATIVCFKFIFGGKLHVTEEAKAEIMEMDEKLVIKDEKLLHKSIFMIGVVIVAFMFHGNLGLESCVVALGAASIMMLIGKQDADHTIEGVEWSTIVFFTGLFVLVGGLVQVGLIDTLANMLIEVTGGNMLVTMLIILWASAILSSILDNIPFVATMIPLILTMQADGIDVMPLWWALSLGACLGGNGTLIGASANVVLSGISNKHGYPITFASYTKIAFPLMIMSMVICTVYMVIRYAV